MNILTKFLATACLSMMWVTEAAAIKCNAGSIVGSPKAVEAALKQVFWKEVQSLAKQNSISLKQVSVRLKSLRYSENSFGVKGARAYLRVEAVTARGTRIAIQEYGDSGFEDIDVWLYPQSRVVPGTEGGSAYCSAGMNIGSQMGLVNVATDEVFGGGYVDSQFSRHINLKTGQVIKGF